MTIVYKIGIDGNGLPTEEEIHAVGKNCRTADEFAMKLNASTSGGVQKMHPGRTSLGGDIRSELIITVGPRFILAHNNFTLYILNREIDDDEGVNIFRYAKKENQYFESSMHPIDSSIEQKLKELHQESPMPVALVHRAVAMMHSFIDAKIDPVNKSVKRLSDRVSSNFWFLMCVMIALAFLVSVGFHCVDARFFRHENAVYNQVDAVNQSFIRQIKTINDESMLMDLRNTKTAKEVKQLQREIQELDEKEKMHNNMIQELKETVAVYGRQLENATSKIAALDQQLNNATTTIAVLKNTTVPKNALAVFEPKVVIVSWTTIGYILGSMFVAFVVICVIDIVAKTNGA